MVHRFVVAGYVTSYVVFSTAVGFASLLKSTQGIFYHTGKYIFVLAFPFACHCIFCPQASNTMFIFGATWNDCFSHGICIAM